MRLSYILLVLLSVMSADLKGQSGHRNELTAEEKRVIIHKGTERPWTGKYLSNNTKGTYLCKWCDAPLYRSDDQFDSHCGWPSFDDEIPGAIKRQTDADGNRTEIMCANCGGHLGHVFEGEELTSKNIRHCVNSVSIDFKPDIAPVPKQSTETAIFAAGCFWGVQHYFSQAPGVISTKVGYTGGSKTNPTYKEVCSHATGHVEAIQVVFDPHQTTFEELAKLFFEIHDPTQTTGQGPDIGPQYLSGIFYSDNNQEAVAEKLIGILKAKGMKIATKVRPATTFWPAEEYHQDYYEKTGGTPYCHVRTNRSW